MAKLGGGYYLRVTLHAEIEQYRSLLLDKQTQRPKIQEDGQLLHAQPGKTKFYPVSNKAVHT